MRGSSQAKPLRLILTHGAQRARFLHKPTELVAFIRMLVNRYRLKVIPALIDGHGRIGRVINSLKHLFRKHCRACNPVPETPVIAP